MNSLRLVFGGVVLAAVAAGLAGADMIPAEKSNLDRAELSRMNEVEARYGIFEPEPLMDDSDPFETLESAAEAGEPVRLAQAPTQEPVPEEDVAEEEPSELAPAPPAVREADDYSPPSLEQRIDLDAIELEPFYQRLEARAPRDEIPLTLEECIRRALDSNLDIQIMSLSPMKSAADIMAARGEFDPRGTGSIMYTRSQQQASSQTVVFGGITSIEDYRTRGQAGIGGRLPWGTQYDLSLLVEREENTFNFFIEEWSGGLTVSLTQPLLRGRGRRVNLARVRMAQNSEEAAEYQLKLQVMSSLAEVIKAYWDLVGATEERRVRQSSMTNAERLLALNEKRLEIGTGAAIDVVQARAGLAARQSDVITAMGAVSDATNRLRTLLNVRPGELLQERRIIPVDRPYPDPVDIDVDTSMARALEMRPELQSGQLAIENAQINKAVARNDLLPQLDVGGTVFQGGRGPDKDDVFTGIRERRDDSYSVNIQGSVPIGNRTARGQFQRSRIEESEAERQLEKTRQDIMLTVRTALTSIETNQTLVESSRQSRTLQEVNVAAEEKRLELGLTSSYMVLDIQDDLTAAQSQEVQAVINLEKAFVDLRLAEGSLLDELGIEFVPPEPEPTVRFVRSVVPFIDKE